MVKVRPLFPFVIHQQFVLLHRPPARPRPRNQRGLHLAHSCQQLRCRPHISRTFGGRRSFRFIARRIYPATATCVARRSSRVISSRRDPATAPRSTPTCSPATQGPHIATRQSHLSRLAYYTARTSRARPRLVYASRTNVAAGPSNCCKTQHHGGPHTRDATICHPDDPIPWVIAIECAPAGSRSTIPQQACSWIMRTTDARSTPGHRGPPTSSPRRSIMARTSAQLRLTPSRSSTRNSSKSSPSTKSGSSSGSPSRTPFLPSSKFHPSPWSPTSHENFVSSWTYPLRAATSPARRLSPSTAQLLKPPQRRQSTSSVTRFLASFTRSPSRRQTSPSLWQNGISKTVFGASTVRQARNGILRTSTPPRTPRPS